MAPILASTSAVPTVGCPANGSSASGVKMRSRLLCRESLGGNTIVVVASEYALTPVHGVVHPNRLLREAGCAVVGAVCPAGDTYCSTQGIGSGKQLVDQDRAPCRRVTVDEAWALHQRLRRREGALDAVDRFFLVAKLERLAPGSGTPRILPGRSFANRY